MRLSKFPKSMMAYITENGDLVISLVSDSQRSSIEISPLRRRRWNFTAKAVRRGERGGFL